MADSHVTHRPGARARVPPAPRRSARWRRSAVVLGVVVAIELGAIAPARADGLEEFERAREAYVHQSYETAVERFEELVGGEVPQLRDGPLVLESRKYLAAAYLFLGQRDAARKQFELLLQEDSDYRLDRAAFPSEVHSVFRQVQERLEREQRAREESRRRLEQERREQAAQRMLRAEERIAELRELAGTETVERVNSRWIAAIPFGVGQFQNGHDRLGLTLAISEGLLAAVSIGTAIAHQTLRDDANRHLSGTDRELARRAERSLRLANWSATGLLAAVAVAGIIDAQVRFQKVDRTTRRRALPSHLEDSLDLDPEGLLDEERDASSASGGPALELSLGLTGASMRLRF